MEDRRPIRLTDEEKRYNFKEDSLQTVRRSPEYRDSVRAKYNKFGVGDLLVSGYYYTFKSDSAWLSVNSLAEGVSFNTVEGWLGRVGLGYSKLYDDRRFLRINGSGRYGFANKTFGGTGSLTYRFDPKESESIRIEGGRSFFQYNQAQPISMFMNMAYSLLAEQNFLKQFQKTFASATYSKEVVNGLYVDASAEWADRVFKENATDFTWVDVDDREYTSNLPNDNFTGELQRHQQLTTTVNVRYRMKQRYELTPTYKYVLPSKYPILKAGYTRGIGLKNSDSNYDHIRGGIEHTLKLGTFGNSRYEVIAGKFFRHGETNFLDYKHFLGNETLFINTRFRAFETLPYYQFSTNDWYIEGHYRHQFNGFLLSKIPLVKKLKMQSLAGTNFVIQQDQSYYELFFGLENIFGFLRVDLAGTYEAGEKFRPAVRIGLDLGL